MINKIFKILMVPFIIGTLLLACTQTKTSEVKTEKKMTEKVESGKTEILAGGYDLVSYFVTNEALKGDSKTAVIYQGAKLLFSSVENKKKFETNPDKYLPGYEGYCPYSLSEGKKIKGKPNHWRIVKDRLYFFYNEKYARDFEKDQKKLIKKADEKWEKEKNKGM